MSKVLKNKTRQLLIDEYIKSLNEKEIPWMKGWRMKNPINAVTGKEYRNVNRLILSLISSNMKYNDSRWCTFNQAKKNNWYVKKGEKATPIEFFTFYDRQEKKKLSISEYNDFVHKLNASNYSDEQKKDRLKAIVMRSKNWNVFNVDQLEELFYEHRSGAFRLSIDDYYSKIKSLDTQEEKEIFQSQYKLIHRPVPSREFAIDAARAYDVPNIIKTAIENMGVTVVEEGQQPCYIPLLDTIKIPRSSEFDNSYEWNATLLHELCHSTGHPSRLDRSIEFPFGSREYAIEELRAEIGSSFLCAELGIEPSEKEINNHKAYIQSWISLLEKDPSVLFKSINDSDKIVDYIKDKGDFEHQLKLSKDVLVQRICDFSIRMDLYNYKDIYDNYEDFVYSVSMDLEARPDDIINRLKFWNDSGLTEDDSRISKSLIAAIHEYSEQDNKIGEREYEEFEL